MSSVVIDLQNEITSPNCDIVNVLRRAHVIAKKLELDDFDQWISYELNGYPNQETCPEYRQIRGSLKGLDPYRGWIPAIITDSKLERVVCEKKIANSISELVELCKVSDNGLALEFTGGQGQELNRLFGRDAPMKYTLQIPSASVMSIIEKVKNAILDWTFKLEEGGVVGDGMRFSEDEKRAAVSIPQTVNHYYVTTNVINAPSEGMKIISGNESVTFTYNTANDAVVEIEKAVSQEQLQDEDKDVVLEILSEIKEKISNEKKPGIIKALLIGLKDFLIDVGASVTAEIIQHKLNGLF